MKEIQHLKEYYNKLYHKINSTRFEFNDFEWAIYQNKI